MYPCRFEVVKRSFLCHNWSAASAMARRRPQSSIERVTVTRSRILVRRFASDANAQAAPKNSEALHQAPQRGDANKKMACRKP
jgi:hypothetical protein